jgi:hypothetical protein
MQLKLLCLAILLTCTSVNAQQIELVFPETIAGKYGRPTSINMPHCKKVILYNSTDNKLIMWDVIQNRQAYSLTFSSEIRQVVGHSAKAIFSVCLNNRIEVYNANNGLLLFGTEGSNYVINGGSLFLNQSFLYTKNDSIIARSLIDFNILQTWKQKDGHEFLNVSFLPPNYLIANHENGTSIYMDEEWKTELSNAIIYADQYIGLDEGIVVANNSEIKFYDSKTFRIDYSKSLGGIKPHYLKDGKMLLEEGQEAIITDLATNKRIKKLALEVDKVYETCLSGDSNRIAFLGRKDGEMYLQLVDLKTFKTIPLDVNAISDNASAINGLFSADGKYVYQILDNGVITNEVVTGKKVGEFLLEPPYEVAVAPSFKPTLIANKYLLLVVQHSSKYTDRLVFIDLLNSKSLWHLDLPNEMYTLEFHKEKEELYLTYDSYKNEESRNFFSVFELRTSNEKAKFSYDGFQKKTVFFQDEKWLTIADTLVVEEGFNFLQYQKLTWYTSQGEVIKTELIKLGGNSLWSAQLKNNLLYCTDTEAIYLIEVGTETVVKSSWPLGATFKIDRVFENNLALIEDTEKDKFDRSIINLTTDLREKDLNLVFHDFNSDVYYLQNKDFELIELSEYGTKWSDINLGFELLNAEKLNEYFIGFHSADSTYLYHTKKHSITHAMLKRYGNTKAISMEGMLVYDFDRLEYVENGYEFVQLQQSSNNLREWKDIQFNEKGNLIYFLNDNLELEYWDIDKNQYGSTPLFASSYEVLQPYYTIINADYIMAGDEGNVQVVTFCKPSTKTVYSAFGAMDPIEDFEITKNGDFMFLKTKEGLRIFDLSLADNDHTIAACSYKIIDQNLMVYDDCEKVVAYDFRADFEQWSVPISHDDYRTYFGGVQNDDLILLNGTQLQLLSIENGALTSSFDLKEKTSVVLGKPIIFLDSFFFVNVGSDFKPKLRKFELQRNKIAELKVKDKDFAFAEAIIAKFELTDKHAWAYQEDIIVYYDFITTEMRIASISTGKELFFDSIQFLNYQLSIAIQDKDSSVLVSNQSGQVFWINYSATKSDVKALNLNANKFLLANRHLFAYDFGKKIDVYNLHKGELLYSVLPLQNSNYIINTPSGFYKATKDGARNMQFSVNKKLYAFDQLDATFNRPDKVLQVFQHADEEVVAAYAGAYQKRKGRLTSNVEIDAISEVYIEITDKNKLETLNEADVVPLEVIVKGNLKNVASIRVSVNDNSELYPFINPGGTTLGEVKQSIEVELGNGMNNIEVTCISSSGSMSLKDQVSVNIQNDTRKPNIYFFGMGVSDYKQVNYNLKYAAKDIRDLSETLKIRYPDIYIDTLINKDATLERFRQWETKLQNLSVDDIVFFSFCGHGVLDDELNWFFATHAMDFSNPKESGLSFENVMAMVSQVKARKKLVTLDACHSGEVDIDGLAMKQLTKSNVVKPYARGVEIMDETKKKYDSFTLMKELFSDLESRSGTIVISASGGMEYAMETEKYQNGVFTYSLIESLENNVWNTLPISQLQKTVIDKVSERTLGLQKPTVRLGTLNYDWIVW